MQALNLNSRQSIYFGISYVIALRWKPNAARRLEFQKKLAEQQLDFSQTRLGSQNFMLIRTEPSPLTINLSSSEPAGGANISISSGSPTYGLEMFCKEAQAVCLAYRQTWLPEQFQILRTTATIRHLYDCREHAFKYLWEERLGQNPEDFKFLGGRPVAGGGLRLLMPAAKDEKEPLQIEVKIESFLRQPKKLFTETILLWPKPRLLGENEGFDAGLRLQRVEEYATSEVCNFIQRKEQQE